MSAWLDTAGVFCGRLIALDALSTPSQPLASPPITKDSFKTPSRRRVASTLQLFLKRVPACFSRLSCQPPLTRHAPPPRASQGGLMGGAEWTRWRLLPPPDRDRGGTVVRLLHAGRGSSARCLKRRRPAPGCLRWLPLSWPDSVLSRSVPFNRDCLGSASPGDAPMFCCSTLVPGLFQSLGTRFAPCIH